MRSIENLGYKDMPDWLKKCLSCAHSYTTQDNDLEIKCRCRKGCNYKAYKNKENKVKCQ